MLQNVLKYLSLSVVVCLAGCTTPWKASIYEILQVPASTRIYLTSNHWFTQPLEMDSFNYQTGDILTFGTEVFDVDFDDDFVSFKSKESGLAFRIALMKNYAMISMNQYLKKTFMATNPAEMELTINATTFEKIVRGVVEEGMTKDQVQIAYGEPSRHRTPSMKADTWIYHESNAQTKRVVFKKGIVTHLLNY